MSESVSHPEKPRAGQQQPAAVEQLQRLLLPCQGEPSDVRTLYLMETDPAGGRASYRDRFSVTVPAGSELSFETYFNAFPASYWRRYSQLDTVTLKLDVAGIARIDVYRSRPNGGRIAVEAGIGNNSTLAFELSLAPFEDGGWYWFDVTAETEATVANAGWFAPVAPGPQELPDGTHVGPLDKRVTVGIPTFNRPADAVRALEALAADPEVDAIIDAVLMPDQGTQHPADEPGYAEVTAHFGERFHEFRQGNLGGSGGYSRIMFEALGGVDGEGKADAGSPFILFMDDDIAIEPDSILRAVQIGRYCARPTIIGGQMLNLLNRSELRTMGEVVNRGDFMWGPAKYAHYDHDFAEVPMSDLGNPEDSPKARNARDLHRRIEVDYNGWWMCMFPRVVAERLGQPLPLFIKWDDTEYSLRARAAGFETATWPGVAIWHMSWADKDDAIDWQAYFHLRNRLIVAALHHEGRIDGIIRSLRKTTFKHAMCMEYSTLAIQLEAMRDFLAGPDQLFDILESSLPRINKLRAKFSDAQKLPAASALPAASGAPGVPTRPVGGRLGKLKKIPWLVKGVAHSLKPADPQAHRVPQLNLAKDEALWFALSRVDGATVTTADGKNVVYRKRDRQEATELVTETLKLHRELRSRFDDMRAQYRAAAGELTSRESWGRIFR